MVKSQQPVYLPRPRANPEWPPETVQPSVRLRAQVADLVRTDPRRALRVARTVPHPWYRCQALSTVAEVLPPGGEQRAVLRAALVAAAAQTEPNRVATVSSWPLRVMAGVGSYAHWLEDEVERLLTVMRSEPHPFRRADGLVALAHGTPARRRQVLLEAAQSYLACHGWKRDWRLSSLVEQLAPLDHQQAVVIATAMEDQRRRRKALQALGVSEVTGNGEHFASPAAGPRQAD